MREEVTIFVSDKIDFKLKMKTSEKTSVYKGVNSSRRYNKGKYMGTNTEAPK